jgi:rhodanese-related sulfurtransferase
LDQPIVVHCAIEHRGAMAMAALRLLGYTNVLSLDGGFTAWTNAKLPVETGTPAAPVAGTAAAVDPARLADLNNFLSNLPANFDGLMDTDVLKAINSATPPTIIDVRTPDDITAAGGSIAGSIFIPFTSLLSDMTKLPSDKTTSIVTVSSDGQNGAVAAMALHMLGYTNVNSMFFGFNGWATDKLPIHQ